MTFSPFFIEIDSITHKLWQKDTNSSNNKQLTGMMPQVGGCFARAWSASFSTRLNPGSNPGQAQIDEIVKFLAKTGDPRGLSLRPPDQDV